MNLPIEPDEENRMQSVHTSFWAAAVLILLIVPLLFGQNADSVARNQYHPSTQPTSCNLGDTWFNPSPATAGQNWYGCTSANTWTLMSGGGGAAACDDATLTSTTVSVFVNASGSNKCTYTFNSAPQQISAPVAVTNPTGPPDVFYFGVSTAGTLVVGATSATATCASCAGGATLTGVTSFHNLGSSVRPLYTAASTGTSWTGTLGNFRALQSATPLTAGAGIVLVDSGSSIQISSTGAAPFRFSGNCSGASLSGANGVSLDLLGGGVSSGSCAAAATYYFGTPVETACTLQRLIVNVGIASSTSGDGVAVVHTTNVDGTSDSATALTCTLGTANSCVDNTHTAAAAAGQFVWIKTATNSSGATGASHWSAAVECK